MDTILIDVAAGREVMRTDKLVHGFSPDGQRILAASFPKGGEFASHKWRHLVYDLPPGRDRRWVAAGTIVWSLVVAAILYVRQRIRRRAKSNDEAVPDSQPSEGR